VRSHHGLYEEVLRGDDHKDADREREMYKDKLTMTEAILGITISIVVVSFMAIFLVEKIDYIVEEHNIKDA
jgi:Ca2+:H+ antiporter